MTASNLVLTFPKDRAEEVTILGSPFIQVDTGMTIDAFILALMRYGASDKPGIAFVKKTEKSEKDEKSNYDGGERMPKEPVEVCTVWKQSDGTELVHTGTYVFDTTTIREVRELLAMYADSDLGMPDRFEI